MILGAATEPGHLLALWLGLIGVALVHGEHLVSPLWPRSDVLGPEGVGVLEAPPMIPGVATEPGHLLALWLGLVCIALVHGERLVSPLWPRSRVLGLEGVGYSRLLL